MFRFINESCWKMEDLHEESLLKDEDFQEDEVWAHVWKGTEESNPKVNKSEKLKRTIVNGSRVPYHHHHHHHHQQQHQKKQQSSATIRIPDWSKIYKENPKYSSDRCDKDDDVNGIIYGEDEMMPPHEYINRRVARSQIAPFSMCEGVGRTLKGRDLRKLRNAILTKTGFLE